MEYTVEAVFGRTSPGVRAQEKGCEGQLQVITEPLIKRFRVRDSLEAIKCLVTNAALLCESCHIYIIEMSINISATFLEKRNRIIKDKLLHLSHIPVPLL